MYKPTSNNYVEIEEVYEGIKNAIEKVKSD